MFDSSAIQLTPIILRGYSAFFIYLGAEHVVRGVKKYLSPDQRAKLPSDVIALMDSQYRFLGGIFMGYGVAVAWTASDIAERHATLNILMAAMVMGGIARGVSGAVFGWPIPWLRRATGFELIIPALTYWFGVRTYV
ncbi:hypothetical protein FLONG3_1579 [Fusarium longipes]|uniref:Uncharacterized protein n=1 Tax=Fusarium longipes TaxID=694270 RepID=A0A395T6D5_9HYPO|nr:hypothetical protein FLONG3_1579 [Fusarium longipes]